MAYTLEVVLISLAALVASRKPLKLTIDTRVDSYPLQKFWKSTGFSPPHSDPILAKEYILSNDVKLNLAIISSLPQQGIEYVRIHWLLSLLNVRSEDGSIVWDSLDEILDTITDNGMKPIFELMGNSDVLIFGKKQGSSFWRNLTASLISRYLHKYGEKEMLTWKFETWNEPDLVMYNKLKFTLKEFLDYVDGTIDGLKSILPKVQVGGPAGLFKNTLHHPLCWGFLKHCNESVNRCNLDYISFHKKGNGTVSKIINGTLNVIELFKKYYANLSQIPLVNDESDILTGWWRFEEWRGDVHYAAGIIKTIFLYKEIQKKFNVQRISIDNGFLSNIASFDQRTLLTRFTTGERNITFVQKPAFSAMGLLAILGEEEIPVEVKTDKRLSIMVTCTKNKQRTNFLSSSVLLSLSSDNMEINPFSIMMKLKIIFPYNFTDARYALYVINNDLLHPKQVWENFGKPVKPTKKQIVEMHYAQEPHRVTLRRFRGSILKHTFKVAHPSVNILHICTNEVDKPEQIIGLKIFNISFNEVLLVWKDPLANKRCLKTYVVEHCGKSKACGHFEKVNKIDVVFNMYFHTYLSNNEEDGETEHTRGQYRIAAIDYWGRKGEYSKSINYG